jgi:hypothetical protein
MDGCDLAGCIDDDPVRSVRLDRARRPTEHWSQLEPKAGVQLNMGRIEGRLSRLQDILAAGVGGDPDEPLLPRIPSDENQVSRGWRDATLIERAGVPKVKVDSAAISEDELRHLADRLEVLHQTRRGRIVGDWRSDAGCNQNRHARCDDGPLLHEGLATEV